MFHDLIWFEPCSYRTAHQERSIWGGCVGTSHRRQSDHFCTRIIHRATCQYCRLVQHASWGEQMNCHAIWHAIMNRYEHIMKLSKLCWQALHSIDKTTCSKCPYNFVLVLSMHIILSNCTLNQDQSLDHCKCLWKPNKLYICLLFYIAARYCYTIKSAIVFWWLYTSSDT